MEARKKEEQTKKTESLGLYITGTDTHFMDAGQQEEIKAGDYALLFVITGGMEVRKDDFGRTVSDGECILLHPGAQVLFCSDPEAGCQWVRVRFSGKAAADTLEYLGIRPFASYSFGFSAATAALDALLTFQAAGEYFRAQIQLQNLLISLLEGTSLGSRESELRQVYEYMMEHFQEPLDLTGLAAMYGTSVSYFTRVFRAKYGHTPIQFLNGMRMINARLLLETSQMKVSEIAAACGYEKPEYFCYVFKKQEGCTPTQYRMNRRSLL